MPDPRRLDQKVILISGGTQGLGETIARRAAELGASGLLLSGRNRERGEAVAIDLSQVDCRTVFVQADLADPDACRKIVARCDEEFGRIDGLVNSAADTSRGNWEDTSVDLWDRMLAVNTRAPFVLMQESIRIMRREKISGSIVNVLSMSAHGGQPFLVAYSVSKGALATLTKNAANAFVHDRIRVNGLNIGWMATAGEHAIQKLDGNPSDWLEKADARMPYGRILRPEDVAGIAVYLLSDESAMMNGALVDFDQHVMGIYNP
jgi:NAD(P)-dependent dehydrogenase (short-subunit alcohol dehydrogenase family)